MMLITNNDNKKKEKTTVDRPRGRRETNFAPFLIHSFIHLESLVDIRMSKWANLLVVNREPERKRGKCRVKVKLNTPQSTVSGARSNENKTR